MSKITVYHIWGKNRRGQEQQFDVLSPVSIGQIVCDKDTRKNYKVVDYAQYSLERSIK